MPDPSKSKTRRRPHFLRRLTLLLMRLGIASEMVAVVGMILGVLAGIAYMTTGEISRPNLAWGLGAILCLARIVAIQLDGMLQPISTRQSREEEFYNELPERVSDAVTLLGFGFAVDSDPWLGLAAALSAILSAYVRSFAFSRVVAKKHLWTIMTRTQRLFILCLAAILMIAGLPARFPEIDLPVVTLWIIVAGCLTTVCLRWFSLRGIKV